jgi:hypothetical protein
MSVMESPKNTTRFSPGRSWLESSIGFSVARQPAEVVHKHGHLRQSPSLQPLGPGHRLGRGIWLHRLGGLLRESGQ